MAPEPPSDQQQGLRKDQNPHHRSKSEPRQFQTRSAPSSPIFPGDHLGGKTPSATIDLTEDDPDDKTRKHARDEESHPRASNKRPKVCNESIENPETARSSRTSATMSDDGTRHSKADSGHFQSSEAKSKKELKSERHAHSLTKDTLKSTTKSLQIIEMKYDVKRQSLSALTKVHNDTQQRLNSLEKTNADMQQRLRDHEQVLQNERGQHELDIQSAVYKEEQSERALQTELEAVRQRVQNIEHSSQEKLKIKDRELKTTKRKLAASENELKSAITQGQAAIEDNETSRELHEARGVTIKKLEARNKFLEKRAAESKKELKSSQAGHDSELSQLNLQVEELKTQMSKLQTDAESQAMQHNEAMKDLLQQVRDSHGLSQRHNFKASDEEIIDDWGNLQHKIGQFVDKYTRTIPVPEQQLDRSWVALSPNIPDLVASPLSSAFAFEAYLWDWLVMAVFNPDSLVWAGNMGRSLDSLSSKVEDQIRGPDDELIVEYHSWRATSCNLLSRISERGYNHQLYHDNVHALVARLHALLGPEFNQKDAFDDLVAILNDARAFEIKRRKLKSKVLVCSADCDDAGAVLKHDMPVNDSLMRRRGPRLPIGTADAIANGVPTVKLVVSPAIVRWGNSNGVDYGRKTCLVKMNVLYSQSPNFVPELTAQPVLAAGNEQFDPNRTEVHGTQASMKFKVEPGTEEEHSDLQTTSGQLGRLAHSTPASMAPNSNSRPCRAAQQGARELYQQQLNFNGQSEDELQAESFSCEESNNSKPLKLEEAQFSR